MQSYKYAKFDLQLFAWLRGIRSSNSTATTAEAVIALGATKNATLQRHVSRRFTQLEDKGVLECTHRGTTRICRVVADIPETMAKQPWRVGITKSVHQHLDATGRPQRATVSTAAPSIRAANSAAYEAAGGIIERLPSNWDVPRTGSKPLGDSFTFDD